MRGMRLFTNVAVLSRLLVRVASGPLNRGRNDAIPISGGDCRYLNMSFLRGSDVNEIDELYTLLYNKNKGDDNNDGNELFKC